MACCGKRGARAEAERAERAERTDAARQAAPQEENIELEEDPSAFNSGREGHIAITPFATDDSSATAWASQVYALYNQVKESAKALGLAHAEVSSTSSRVMKEMGDALAMLDGIRASLNDWAAAKNGPAMALVYVFTGLVFKTQQESIHFKAAGGILAEAILAAQTARNACVDLQGSFELLVRQAEANAFGGPIHQNTSRPDSNWFRAAADTFQKSSANYQALGTALAAAQAALREASTPQAQVAEGVNAIVTTGQASAEDVAAALTQLAQQLHVAVQSLQKETTTAEDTYTDLQRAHEAADKNMLDGLTKGPSPYAAAVAAAVPKSGDSIRRAFLVTGLTSDYLRLLQASLQEMSSFAQAAVAAHQGIDKAGSEDAKQLAAVGQSSGAAASTIPTQAADNAIQALYRVNGTLSSSTEALLKAKTAAAGEPIKASLATAVEEFKKRIAEALMKLDGLRASAPKNIAENVDHVDEVVQIATGSPATYWGVTSDADVAAKQTAGLELTRALAALSVAAGRVQYSADTLTLDVTASRSSYERVESTVQEVATAKASSTLAASAAAAGSSGIRTVVLTRPPTGGLGLGLRTTEGTLGVRLSATAPGSVAAKSSLQVNDAILSVNGQDISHKTHDEAIQVLQAAGETVTLQVAPNFASVVRLVTLRRKAGAGLGFTLASTDGVTRVQVVAAGTVAADCGQIYEGDYLLRVNGATTSGTTHEAVVSQLRSSEEVAVVLASTPDAVIPLQLTMTEDARMAVDEGDDFAVVKAVLSSVATPPEDQRRVTLDRSRGSLGLRLKSSTETSGVYIESVVPSSQAANEASIKPNDYIWAVNGVSTAGRTHDEVVLMIQAAETEVVLLLSQKAPPETAAAETKVEAVPAGAGPTVSLEQAAASSSMVQDGTAYRITLVKPTGAGFGLRVRGSEEPGVAIIGAAPGTVAEKAGLGALETTMPNIMTLNGEDVRSKNHDQLVGMLKGLDKLELVLQFVPAAAEPAPAIHPTPTTSMLVTRAITMEAAVADSKLEDLGNGDFRVLLVKPTDAGFGLRITGSDEPGVVVTGAAPGTVADRIGLGRFEGQRARIVDIDGENSMNLTHNETVQRLGVRPKVVLLLRLDAGGETAEAPVVASTSSVAPTAAVREVVLRSAGRGLGLRLRTFDDENMTRIAEVVPGGAAEATGAVFANDILVGVDGINVETANHQTVVDLLTKGGRTGECRLQLRSDAAAAPAAAVTPTPTPAAGPTTVTITRSPDTNWGMKLASVEHDKANEDADRGCLIVEVYANSPAAAGGVLPGSQVLAVSATDTTTMSHAGIINLLVSAGDSLTLTLAPHPGAAKVMAQLSVREVTLKRQAGRNFGIKLSTATEGEGTCISEVLPDGLAEQSGQIFVDDCLLAINDVDVSFASHEKIVQLLTSAKDGQVKLKLGPEFPARAGVVTAADTGTTSPMTSTTGAAVVPAAAALAAAAAVAAPTTSSSTPGTQRLIFHINKPTGMPLGLRLTTAEDKGVGVEITEVLANGSAHGSGLQPGDRIVAINGQGATNTSHEDVVAALSHGSSFDIEVERRLPGGLRRTLLRRDAEVGFGLQLTTEDGSQGCIISNKIPGTPTANDPVLKVGDHIVSLNGQNVEFADHDAVIALCKGTETLDIVVRDRTAPATAVEAHRYRVVTLDRRGGKRLGLKLRTDVNQIGATVQEVLPEGLASQAGINAGDRIVEINGVNMEKANHATIVEACANRDVLTMVLDPAAFRQAARAKLVIERGAAASLGMRLRTGEDQAGVYVFAVEPGSPAEVAGVQVGDVIKSVDGADVTQAAHTDVVARIKDKARLELEVERMVHFPTPVAEQPLGLPIKALPSPTLSPLPMSYSDFDAPNLRQVSLQRGQGKAREFGFAVGTKEDVYGARVLEVSPDGMAAQSGLVKKGDALLVINGRSMLYASADEIVAALRRTADSLDLVLADDFPATARVEMTLRRSAYDQPWGMALRAIPQKTGSVVVSVAPGSAAARAGVRVEDRIVAISGIDVSGFNYEPVLHQIELNEKSLELAIAVERASRRETNGGLPSPLASPKKTAFPGGCKPRTALRDVTVTRQEGERLGMRLASDETGTTVASLDAEGLVARSGQVLAGDHIFAINDRDMTNATEAELKDALRMSQTLRLVVDSKAPLLGRTPSAAGGPQPETRVIRVRNLHSQGLGMVLVSRHTDNLTAVKELAEDGVAAEAGVEVGDIILMVNGMHVELEPHDVVLSALKAPGDLVLVLGRHFRRATTLRRGAMGFGLRLKALGNKGAAVAEVAQGSVAMEDGSIHEGDVLVRANGKNCRNMSCATIAKLLAGALEATIEVAPAEGMESGEVEAVIMNQDTVERAREELMAQTTARVAAERKTTVLAAELAETKARLTLAERIKSAADVPPATAATAVQLGPTPEQIAADMVAEVEAHRVQMESRLTEAHMKLAEKQQKTQQLEQQLEEAKKEASTAVFTASERETQMQQQIAELEERIAALQQATPRTPTSESPNGVEDVEGEVANVDSATAAVVLAQAAEASEVLAQCPTSPKSRYQAEGADSIDRKVGELLTSMGLTKNDAVRVGPGKYKFFGDPRMVLVKLVGNVLSTRIGQTYMALPKYLNEHRSSSQTSA